MSTEIKKNGSLQGYFGALMALLLAALFLTYFVRGELGINISLRSNAELENGLVAYWNFDGSNLSTSTVVDSSGNGRSIVHKDFVKLFTDYTAGTTTYAIPGNVNLILSKAWGGGGGGLPGGGNGGFSRGQINVSPGENIIYEVGDNVSSGGASTVKRALTYLMIAGGGGGGGGSVGFSCDGGGGTVYSGFGGSGGGLIGGDGGAGGCGSDFTDDAAGGTGGTQSAGGSGGGGLGTGTDGSSGIANAGGNGGAAGTCGSNATGCGGSGPSGSGGGGYFGGGGGEAALLSGDSGAGGGGGGASYHNNNYVVASSTLSGDTWPSDDDPDRGTAGVAGDPANEGGVVFYGHMHATSTRVAGRIGQAAKFNANILSGNAGSTTGTSTIFSMPSTSGVVQNAGAATVAFWINTDDFKTNYYQTPVNISRGTTDQSARFQVQVVGTSTTQGVIRVSARAGDSESIQFATTTSAQLAEGRWHHIIAVTDYANDTVTVYVDGSTSATTGTISFTASATSNTSPLAVELGRSATSSLSNFNDAFKGALDDVRIYSRALSATEVSRLYQIGATTNQNVSLRSNAQLENNLALYYSFDKGTVGTSSITDLSTSALSSAYFVTGPFSFTSGSTTFAVPGGAGTAAIKVWGAGGGGGDCFAVDFVSIGCNGGDGGGGGYAKADISLNSLETLYVEVGDGGDTSGTPGEGGGYTAVRRSSTYLIQAGGGGGGGYADDDNGGINATGGSGGAGGGSSGLAGTDGSASPGDEGEGGTNLAGGAGGTGGAGTNGAAGVANAGGIGGGTGTGGAGVGAGGVYGTSGGGGGGGRFGGGGGENSTGVSTAAGGGGGGGSSLTTGSNTIETAGAGAVPGNSSDADNGGAGTGGLPKMMSCILTEACATDQGATEGTDGKVVIFVSGTSSTSPVVGRIGQGMGFDGAHGLIRVATSSGTTIWRNISAGTFAAWVKVDDFSSGVHQTIVSIARGSTDDSERFEIQAVGTSTSRGVVRISARAGDGESIQFATTSSAVLLEGQWHHIVGVVNYASDTYTLYVDGAVATLNVSPSFTASASSDTAPRALEFGRHNNSTSTPQLFDGAMDDVRIYHSALSASEALRLYHLGATTQVNTTLTTDANATVGLTGHWTFDGPRMYQNVSDIGTGGVVGRLVGFTSTTSVPGRIGQGLDFDGTDDYVTVGNAGSGKKTVTFWMKTDDNSTRKILNIDGTDQVELNSSAAIAATSFPGTTIIYVNGQTSTNFVATSTWTHVAITDTTGVNASTFEIGRVSTSYYDGVLDDVRLYDRVLTAGEVTKLYQLGSPRGSTMVPFAFNERSPLVRYARGLYELPQSFLVGYKNRAAVADHGREQLRGYAQRTMANVIAQFTHMAEAQKETDVRDTACYEVGYSGDEGVMLGRNRVGTIRSRKVDSTSV